MKGRLGDTQQCRGGAGIAWYSGLDLGEKSGLRPLADIGLAPARADEVLVETSAVCAGEGARSGRIWLSEQVTFGVNLQLEVE